MKELSDQEVLQAAIEKAIKGGYVTEDWVQGPGHLATTVLQQGTLEQLIFSHEFCKALWGSRTVNALNGNKFVAKKLPDGVIETVYVDLAWEYHIKQLAVAEDRIDYLRKNM